METTANYSRQWTLACHLTAFCGYIIPFGNIIGPLVVWLMKKDEYPSVDEHGKESLNFQISFTIYVFASLILILILVGIALLVALAVIQIIFIIMAALKADKGEFFRYPLTIRFIK